MTFEDIGNIFKFAGGIGMFLYGMNLLSESLRTMAAGRMSHFVNVFTGNRFKAVIAGALITALIQSSSAATVMVVGLVNAGIINLIQAAGVIMGANIGTTITSWVVSLGQFGSTVKVLSPSYFAPVLIFAGAFARIFSDKRKTGATPDLLVGAGMLFIGLDFMSASFEVYADSPVIGNIFSVLGGNPLLSVIAGALITALLQSSSASIGILQSLSLTGAVNFGAAVFIMLGQNIGSCVTALISGIGAQRTAKRAAVIHLLFNVAGALIFGTGLYVYFMFFNRQIRMAEITSVQISIFHTLFNVVNTLILFPFAEIMVRLSGVIVKEREEEKGEDIVALCEKRLDTRILGSTSLAVENVLDEISLMGSMALENVENAMAISENQKECTIDTVYAAEKNIDRMQEILTGYLIKINSDVSDISINEKIKDYISVVNDFERIGDHAENIAELGRYMAERQMELSDTGLHDLHKIGDLVIQAIKDAVSIIKETASDRDCTVEIESIESIEDEVDSLKKSFREKHVDRLTKGECSVETGVIFLDIVSNLERICDHCHNIAVYSKV